MCIKNLNIPSITPVDQSCDLGEERATERRHCKLWVLNPFTIVLEICWTGVYREYRKYGLEFMENICNTKIL